MPSKQEILTSRREAFANLRDIQLKADSIDMDYAREASSRYAGSFFHWAAPRGNEVSFIKAIRMSIGDLSISSASTASQAESEIRKADSRRKTLTGAMLFILYRIEQSYQVTSPTNSSLYVTLSRHLEHIEAADRVECLDALKHHIAGLADDKVPSLDGMTKNDFITALETPIDALKSRVSLSA